MEEERCLIKSKNLLSHLRQLTRQAQEEQDKAERQNAEQSVVLFLQKFDQEAENSARTGNAGCTFCFSFAPKLARQLAHEELQKLGFRTILGNPDSRGVSVCVVEWNM